MEQFTNPLGLLLPKGYLSFSQMELWEKDPERYKKEYFENAPRFKTKYTVFGSKIASMIENGLHTKILPTLITYSEREYEVRIVVNDVPVFSKLDQYDPINNIFRDDKTSMTPWTNSKVHKTQQLVFYAAALKAKIGKTPREAYIDWIETEEVKSIGLSNGNLRVTGKVVPFRRFIYELEVTVMEKKIQKIAIEISNAYKQFILTI